ncbi:MAG: hypothetical protein K2P81_03430 [Bacteriovoracaceae bacterium]|nr:hypothetical protein [Bacteriovoracaceae bacterium]
MLRIALALIFALSFKAHAQVLTTTTPYDLTSTLGSPFSIPISFDLNGRIALKLNTGNATVFPIMAHFAWERQRYDFIPASVGMKHEWVEAPAETPHLYVYRQKLEAGLGIGAATKLLGGNLGFSLGLVPFKGSSWESRTFKEPSNGKFSLPLSVADWEEWSEGEGRDYQVMGGLTLSIGMTALGMNAANLFKTTQQRWSLSMEKVSSKHLRVRIRQDRWKKKGRILGPFFANWEKAVLDYFDSERSYLVDMTTDVGIEAVKSLWAGRLDELQSSAATQEEVGMRRWQGNYRSRYLGIPYVFGQSTARVELQSWEVEGEGRLLDILNMQVRNNGLLREADPQVWTVVSDPSDETVYFLAISQSLEKGSKGVREKLGRWMENVGLQMQWPEMNKKDFLDARLMFSVPMKSWNAWANELIPVEDYQKSCLEMNLKCQRERLAKKAIEGWSDIKEKSLLVKSEYLIRHPVLWGLLVQKTKEKIVAEFLAHGSRFLPMQKSLSTH